MACAIRGHWRAPRGDRRPALAHIVQQEIGIGPDELEACRIAFGEAMRHEIRLMTCRTAAFIEDLPPLQNLRIINAAARRNTKILAVEGHEAEPGLIYLKTVLLGVVTMFGGTTIALQIRTLPRTSRMDWIGNTDIAHKGACRLLQDRRVSRLVSEPAQHWPVVDIRPDNLRTTGNPVAICVIGIGKCQNVGTRDGFQKPHPDHLRRYARREHGLRMHRTITQVARMVGGLAKSRHLAIRQRHLHLFILNFQAVLGLVAGQAEILKLRSVGRLWRSRMRALDIALQSPQLRIICRNGDAQEERYGIVVRSCRRMPAAILDMATLA